MSILTDIPDGVAGALGVSNEIAGLILSAILLFGIAIMLTLIKKPNPMLLITVVVACMGVLTAIAWLPVWVMVVSLIIVAAMFGSEVMRWVGK